MYSSAMWWDPRFKANLFTKEEHYNSLQTAKEMVFGIRNKQSENIELYIFKKTEVCNVTALNALHHGSDEK